MKAFICCCLPLENLFRNILVLVHLSWYLATLCMDLSNFRKEKFLSNDDSSLNLLSYVSDFKDRLSKACEAARTNLKSAQRKMKRWYDKNAKERKFMPGNRILGPPWFNYWFSFTLAYSRISHEYSSLFIIVIDLIFMFSL